MKLTPAQVELSEAVSRLVMSWLAFIATFVTTALFLALLVWCILKHEDWAAKVTLGVVNGFLLSLLRIIYKHVFSHQPSSGRKASFSKKP